MLRLRESIRYATIASTALRRIASRIALFDPRYYRANCRGTLLPGQNPLEHFLAAGVSAANPHPLFDCQAYLEAHAGVTGNPLLHYLNLPLGQILASRFRTFA